jgi:hypothetical protein
MPGETEYGKGSFPRTWNTDKFRDNYDAIFSKKQVASTSKPEEIGFLTDAMFSEQFLRDNGFGSCGEYHS